MNANEFTFGIEIETLINADVANRNNLRIGNYHNGLQVEYLPEDWTASRDSSLRGRDNDLGCEIVSPVLQGVDGLREIATVAQTLREKGHRVNQTCGVHVHVGLDCRFDSDAAALLKANASRIVKVVSYLENGIYATTGTKNRERGTYCQGVRQYGNATAALDALRDFRYSILNLTNLETRRQPTVEFRAFSGSLNATKLTGWVQLCLGLVQRAFESKRLPVWEPTPAVGGWAKRGVGQTDVERIFGFLGWGAGYARLKNGKQFGWLDGPVSQDEIKAKFRQMAKKYDAQA